MTVPYTEVVTNGPKFALRSGKTQTAGRGDDVRMDREDLFDLDVRRSDELRLGYIEGGLNILSFLLRTGRLQS